MRRLPRRLLEIPRKGYRGVGSCSSCPFWKLYCIHAQSKNEGFDRDTICSQLNITDADIKQYEQKKTQRDERRSKKPYYDNRGGSDRGNNFPPNELAEIYEALSIITKKLDNLSDKDNEILKVLKKSP